MKPKISESVGLLSGDADKRVGKTLAPDFFREICYRKRHGLGGGGYSWAGYQLTVKAADLLALDNSTEAARARVRDLEHLVEMRAGNRVLSWFKSEFPACMKLIKGDDLDRFLEGVDWAFEDLKKER